MARETFTELARSLADRAEAVCRRYLSAGRRSGNYWTVGDLANSKGKSLYVHLAGTRKGRWTDSATGEFGDLLDVIRETRDLREARDLADEVRHFLALPLDDPADLREAQPYQPARRAPGAPRRLFAMARPIADTLAESYLRSRGILCATCERWLRFHPGCYYRDHDGGRTLVLPALLAAITSPDGTITGLHRTWLDPDGAGKALLAEPRRSMGSVLGRGVRLGGSVGPAAPALVAGEGVETLLSLRMVMPAMPAIAATSANHLAALALPPGCERLYIAIDADAAGRRGGAVLGRRARAAGLVVLPLAPRLGDFNEDLRQFGAAPLAAWLRPQLASEDAGLLLLDG